MLTGFGLFLGGWYLAVEVWRLPRFAEMPGLTVVVKEWLSKDPTYGLSLYTPEYYIAVNTGVHGFEARTDADLSTLWKASIS